MSDGVQLLHFNRLQVLIWLRGAGQLPHLESQHLANLMGYVQEGSIRKQITSDWDGQFLHDQDYIILHEEEELRRYETVAALNFGRCKVAKLERGRLFLTASGVRKVLARSTKTTKEFEMFLELKVFAEEEALDLVPAREENRAGMDWKALEETPSSTIQEADPNEVQGERQRKYDVVQQLLHNLSAHQDMVLRELAIEAAELVLGHRLERVREKVLGQKPAAPPPRKTDGPLFEEEGWYSLRQIGKLAGGYSASSAGKAANIVAKRWGHTPSDIRSRKTHFSTFVTREINGAPRTWPEYNRAFSNETVCELRSNESFAPKKSPSAEAVLGRSGNYANLSEDLDFFTGSESPEEVSENMESFLETLENERPKH